MYVLPCLSVVTMGYHVIHLMYVLVINLRVPPMNLCIGVGTRFRTTREKPSSSADFRPSSSAGTRATNKALQLIVSNSVG